MGVFVDPREVVREATRRTREAGRVPLSAEEQERLTTLLAEAKRRLGADADTFDAFYAVGRFLRLVERGTPTEEAWRRVAESWPAARQRWRATAEYETFRDANQVLLALGPVLERIGDAFRQSVAAWRESRRVVGRAVGEVINSVLEGAFEGWGVVLLVAVGLFLLASSQSRT